MNSKYRGKWGKEIISLRDYIKGIISATDDTQLLDYFDNADFFNLEYKLFDQICVFLLKHLQQDMSDTSIIWPVLEKKHHVIFVKKLFEYIDKIKQRYAWYKFPNFQKSHFQDPRADNDKVIDLLLTLCSLTVKVITGSSAANDVIAQDLPDEIQKVNAEIAAASALLIKLQAECEEVQEKIANAGQTLDDKKIELLKLDIITPLDHFSQATLVEKQIAMDKQLFDLVLKVQALRIQFIE